MVDVQAMIMKMSVHSRMIQSASSAIDSCIYQSDLSQKISGFFALQEVILYVPLQRVLIRLPVLLRLLHLLRISGKFLLLVVQIEFIHL